ncbi:hypothetical protein [Nocardia sp. CA-135398]
MVQSTGQWGARHPKQLGRELDGRIWGQMPQSGPVRRPTAAG